MKTVETGSRATSRTESNSENNRGKLKVLRGLLPIAMTPAGFASGLTPAAMGATFSKGW